MYCTQLFSLGRSWTLFLDSTPPTKYHYRKSYPSWSLSTLVLFYNKIKQRSFKEFLWPTTVMYFSCKADYFILSWENPSVRLMNNFLSSKEILYTLLDSSLMQHRWFSSMALQSLKYDRRKLYMIELHRKLLKCLIFFCIDFQSSLSFIV